MDYEQLNLEYRWTIIRVVSLLLTEGIKQEKKINLARKSAGYNLNKEAEIMRSDWNEAMEKIGEILNLPALDLPAEPPSPLVHAHYCACLQLRSIIELLRPRDKSINSSATYLCSCKSYSALTLLYAWQDSNRALQDANSILPNPLADSARSRPGELAR